MSSDSTRSYDDYKTAVIDTTTPYDDDFKQINEYYRAKRSNKSTKTSHSTGKKSTVKKKKEVPNLQLHIDSNTEYDNDFKAELGKFKKSIPGISLNMSLVDWVKSGLSCIWGILLTVLAIVDLTLNIPLVTIIFSIFIIAGAVFCLIKKFRFRAFPIFAIVVAAFCLLYSAVQGRRTGFMVDPATVPYNASTTGSQSGDEEAATDENGVSEDLKAFLTEYQTFIANYVAFMKKFYGNPDGQKSLMDAYINIIDKYDYYAVTIERYDTSSMSAADKAYFEEVINKCNQELAKVM